MNRTKRVSKTSSRAKTSSNNSKAAKKVNSISSLSVMPTTRSIHSGSTISSSQTTRKMSYASHQPSSSVSTLSRRSFAQSSAGSPEFSFGSKMVSKSSSSIEAMPVSTTKANFSNSVTAFKPTTASMISLQEMTAAQPSRGFMTMTASKPQAMTRPAIAKPSIFATTVNTVAMPIQAPSFAPLNIPKRFGHGLGYSHYTDATEIEKRIFDILNSLPAVQKEKISPKAHFRNDLGLDSLSQVELIVLMEHEFEVEISDRDAANIQTVEEAVHYFAHTPYVV